MKKESTNSQQMQAIFTPQELHFAVNGEFLYLINNIKILDTRTHLNQLSLKLILSAVEAQVDELCGAFYDPKSKSKYYRAGSVLSQVFDGNNWHKAKCLRVRERLDNGKSKEVHLSQLAAIKDTSIWEEQLMRNILCGVSYGSVIFSIVQFILFSLATFFTLSLRFSHFLQPLPMIFIFIIFSFF